MADIYSMVLTNDPATYGYEGFPISDEPACIMGKTYHTKHPESFETMKRLLRTKLWCTYRKHFAPIGDTAFTSDSGWGCMLRCGQMMLAEALLRLNLGKDWIWFPNESNPKYWQVVQQFQDDPSANFSIHQIALAGETFLETPVGEWFGPNKVAQCLKNLNNAMENRALEIYVSMDQSIVISDLKTLCKSSGSSQEGDKKSWKPLVLVLPLRFGLNDFNPTYTTSFMMALRMRQSLGIIGGRPSHAVYVVGSVEKQIIFLDPHTTQPAYGPDGKLDDSSFHCSDPGRMDLLCLDPCMAMSFLFETEAEFDEWCKESPKVFTDKEGQTYIGLFQEPQVHSLVYEEYLSEQSEEGDSSDFELL